MYNVEETFDLKVYYFLKKDLYIKGVLFAFVLTLFIDLVRRQVSEVNILQLIPGFYLFLLLVAFIFLIYFSYLFFERPSTLDYLPLGGTKTYIKSEQ
jgi:hypothetical protein